MKISKPLEQLLNEQIRNEYESAYIYLGISVYFMRTPYSGFARWMQIQGREELTHGNKLLEHLGDRSGEVKLLQIAAQRTTYSNPLEAFQVALEHEQRVTSWIHNLYNQAVADKDYAAQSLLDWFINEQIEEEKQTQYFVDRLRLVGDDKSALLLLDQEAGSRSE